MASISNQYAAMPSLHIGWSTWCAIAVWPLLRRRWTKVAVLLYPALTLFCIVVTANHYWLDGIGGLLAFGVGAVVGWGVHRWNQDRLDRRHAQLLEQADGQPEAMSASAESVNADSVNADSVSADSMTSESVTAESATAQSEAADSPAIE